MSLQVSQSFAVIASNGFCWEQLSFTLWSFHSDCSALMHDLSGGLDLKKDVCWNCLYRFRKAFVVIASNGFCCEQLSFTLWSFHSDCSSLMYDLSGGLDLKKNFCWNCLYRFRKAFAVIASNGFCWEQLSFTLWSFHSDCSSLMHDLSGGLDLKKDVCWNCLYRFRKAFAVIASNGFCWEQLSFTLWSFHSDCSSLMHDLSGGLDLKKDVCWNCLYRFRKAFVVIASNGFCCEQLSFTLRSFRSNCSSLMYEF